MILRTFLSLVGVSLLFVVGGLVYFSSAIFPMSYEAEEWRQKIQPHLYTAIHGSDKRPVVFVMHGCGGQRDWLREERLERLAAAGYYTVAIDSFGPRIVDASLVCSGRELWAGERLNDLSAAMDIVASDPRADINRFAVVGFSHGAWAALETYTSNWPLDRQPAAVVAYYPFCEFPNRAVNDWQGMSDLLVFLAESDTITAVEPCRDLFSKRALSQLVDVVSYPGAAHGFDVKDTNDWLDHYNDEFAQDSWQRTIRFLDSRLK